MPSPGSQSCPAAPALFFLMILGLALYGIPGNTMYSHVSVLYAAEDYAPGAVSLMVSLLGGTIAAGKLIYGAVADRIGSYIPAFQIMAAAGVVSAALLLITYAKILRDDADRTQEVEEKRTAAA